MSPNIGRTIATVAAAVSALVTLSAHTAVAQSIQGTATYRERMALPSSAVFEATLEDVSRADAAAETIGGTRLTSPGNPPIKFTITYDPARILADHHYVVRARILVNDQVLFSSDTATPVITRGNPTTVSIVMRRVATAQSPSPGPAGTTRRAAEGVRRLQPGTRHLEVGGHESGRVRPARAVARQVPRRLAARSDCEAVGVYPFLCHEGPSPVPLVDGRWRHLRV